MQAIIACSKFLSKFNCASDNHATLNFRNNSNSTAVA